MLTKNILPIIFLLTSAAPALAQTPRPAPRAAAPATAPSEATVQSRADALTTNMTQGLGLTPAQAEKVRAINVNSVRNVEAARLRYRQDPAVGRRFETLSRELGEAFIRVEFEGRKHSTLTLHRQQEGVDRVLAFFEDKLRD